MGAAVQISTNVKALGIGYNRRGSSILVQCIPRRSVPWSRQIGRPSIKQKASSRFLWQADLGWDVTVPHCLLTAWQYSWLCKMRHNAGCGKTEFDLGLPCQAAASSLLPSCFTLDCSHQSKSTSKCTPKLPSSLLQLLQHQLWLNLAGESHSLKADQRPKLILPP